MKHYNFNTTTPQFLISACLCGVRCRYDGKSTMFPEFLELVENGVAIPVCPEVAGGLPVPREPCEISKGRVLTKNGRDFTDEFMRGARATLEEALSRGITKVILKEKSPSCGSTYIYDGEFTKTLISGEGLTASLFREHGIMVLSEVAFFS